MKTCDSSEILSGLIWAKFNLPCCVIDLGMVYAMYLLFHFPEGILKSRGVRNQRDSCLWVLLDPGIVS